jgi:hypothetical protein
MSELRQEIKNIAVVRVSGMNHHYPTAQMPLTDDRIDAILDAVIAALQASKVGVMASSGWFAGVNDSIAILEAAKGAHNA